MNLSPDQIKALLKMLALTRAEESTCAECLKQMAEFAECKLQGKPVEEGLQAIEHHLAICGECKEEFEALMRALEAA